MDRVLKFNIDKMQILQDESDSQLAIAEIFVCHNLNNLHNMPIDLEDLKMAAPTLLNKFLIGEIVNGDFGTHTDRQQIIGFFPKENNLRYIDRDGKTYLVADAILSKYYATDAYEMFVKDNDRSVSMEISVLKTEIDTIDGLEHIKEFVFNAVSILGKKIEPACVGSNIQLVKFSTDDAQKYYDNFKHQTYSIPDSVKQTIQKGIELHKQFGRGATQTTLNFANKTIEISDISLSSVKKMSEYFLSHNSESEKNPPSNAYISHLLMGGEQGKEWANSIIDKKDNENLSYFIEETKKEVLIMEEKDTTPIEEMSNALMADDENKNIDSEEMSSDANIDNSAIEEINEKNAEDNQELVDEAEQEEEATESSDIIIAGLQEAILKLQEDMATCMAENESLKKFKSDTEATQMTYQVESTLQEVSDVMPKDEIDACRTMSADFSLESIDTWKNAVKAKAFTFTKESKPKETFVRIGLPFAGEQKTSKSIWN